MKNNNLKSKKSSNENVEIKNNKIETKEMEIFDVKEKKQKNGFSVWKYFFNNFLYWINPIHWFRKNDINEKNSPKKIEELANKDLSVSSNRFIKFLKELRIPLVCICSLGVICGIIYPIAVTGLSQVTMPYQANGSKIEITLSDGTKKIFGSELIGQTFYNQNNKQINGTYLFGRPNFSSSVSINSSDHDNNINNQNNIITSVIEDVNNISSNVYPQPIKIPQELIVSSSSGLDPHISVESAKWQIKMIVTKRNELIKSKIINPNTNKEYTSLIPGEELLTEKKVEEIINKFTTNKFALYGVNVVNVLKVNLELDGYKVL